VRSVAVIGAGITGLTAAFYLKRRGVPVTLYEASDRVGGVIGTVVRDGYIAESGPNTLLETSPRIGELVRDAGLQSRRIDADPKADARYIVRHKRPIAVPSSPIGFVRSELFTPRAKLAVLREPFVTRRSDGVDESVAEFVERRLNGEILDVAVDAMVAGIYAGDPKKLSVTHAFPRLKALEDNYGSLIKGQILGARARKRAGRIAPNRAAKISFDNGLQVLPDALAALLGGAVRLNTTVMKLARTGEGWSVHLRSGGETRVASHDAVIYCGTAHRLAELQIDAPERLELATFSEVRYAPVASVVLGFRREDVAHPCDGFGMLVPGVEGFNVLGTIFSSALFPNRAPAGHVLLTTYVGGERQPQLASKSSDELTALVQRDLGVLLGVSGAATVSECVYVEKAIPQYNVGYGRFKQLLTEIEAKSPGLFFAGSFRDGVSLSDAILSGFNVAERVGAPERVRGL
jgi:protoporphyrinogen/coproporphyrinogen III oxidase